MPKVVKNITNKVSEFEIYSLKVDLDTEVKKECIRFMKKEISRRKLKVILSPSESTTLYRLEHLVKLAKMSNSPMLNYYRNRLLDYVNKISIIRKL